MTRRRRWGGVAAVLACALCLSGCQLRIDLGLVGRSDGHLDLLVTVQADEDVRSVLTRAGRLHGLSSRALASRLPAWEVASQDGALLALVARDIAPGDAAGVLEDLVAASGLGADVLTLSVSAVDGDLDHGVDAVVEIGVPTRSAFDGAPIDIDEDRWAAAMAVADEATSAALWVALAEDVDVDASNRDSDVVGIPRGRGIAWPLTVGEPARVGARPARSRQPSPWLLGAAALVVGALGGLLSARGGRRNRRPGQA